MGMFSKRKGKVGEQEVATIHREQLGDILSVVERNSLQSRGGGYDLILKGLPLAVEVKRVEKPSFNQWLLQARQQAGKLLPVLFWRPNKTPWAVTIGPLTVAEYAHVCRALHHYRADQFPGLGNQGAPLNIEDKTSGQ
jgi:hypothetical protein